VPTETAALLKMPKSFLDLPVEINLQILKGCGPNDVTCLSLTWYVSLRHPHRLRLLTKSIQQISL
jgi:hypothetical protein